jgi:glycosyltransferase involved in cell wall biosynthesis
MDSAADTKPIVDVSVVIPIYNGSRFIQHALASVAGQTHLPREVIVVDDGSQDGGAALIEGLSLPFPMRVITQQNAGQSAARNRGARLASQPYVAFLDQDDAWFPQHLAILLDGVRSSASIGWVYGDFDEIDQAGRTVTKRFLREHGVPHPKSTLVGCVNSDIMVIPSASLLRRDAFLEVGGFDESLSGYEDDDLFIRFFRAGWDHLYVDRSVTRFRVHTGSSSDDARFIASRLRFGRKLMETIEDDVRFGRYYYRDVIAPRLFQQCLDDYVRSISAKNWNTAIKARDAMNEFAHQRYDFSRKSWKLRLIQNPRRLRRLLQVQTVLPRWLHLSTNPAMQLR